jgi:tRNA threonylcarbamoyladenosine biosynthesis protein TsaB
MKFLLLNTCGAEGLIALADTDLREPIAASECLPGRASSEQLMPALHRLFASAGWAVRNVEIVAVVHGPGSFTGMRVGLSAAKGLCEALAIPMIAISRLALLAAHPDPSPAASSQADSARPVIALLDGGRGELYTGVYRGRTCLREALLRQPEVQTLVGNSQSFTSEPRVIELLPGQACLRFVPEPSPGLILHLAIERIAAGELTDVASIDANYLRRTDAEIVAASRNRTKLEEPQP